MGFRKMLKIKPPEEDSEEFNKETLNTLGIPVKSDRKRAAKFDAFNKYARNMSGNSKDYLKPRTVNDFDVGNGGGVSQGEYYEEDGGNRFDRVGSPESNGSGGTKNLGGSGTSAAGAGAGAGALAGGRPAENPYAALGGNSGNNPYGGLMNDDNDDFGLHQQHEAMDYGRNNSTSGTRNASRIGSPAPSGSYNNNNNSNNRYGNHFDDAGSVRDLPSYHSNANNTASYSTPPHTPVMSSSASIAPSIQSRRSTSSPLHDYSMNNNNFLNPYNKKLSRWSSTASRNRSSSLMSKNSNRNTISGGTPPQLRKIESNDTESVLDDAKNKLFGHHDSRDNLTIRSPDNYSIVESEHDHDNSDATTINGGGVLYSSTSQLQKPRKLKVNQEDLNNLPVEEEEDLNELPEEYNGNDQFHQYNQAGFEAQQDEDENQHQVAIDTPYSQTQSFFDEERRRAELELQQEDQEVDAIKQEIKFTKQQSVASTRNTMRMANEAEVSGQNTLGMLGAQGETLYNVERNLTLAKTQNKIADDKVKELKKLNRNFMAVHVTNPFNSKRRLHEKEVKIKNQKDEEKLIEERLRAQQYQTERRVMSGLSSKEKEKSTLFDRYDTKKRLEEAKRYQYDNDKEDDEMELEISRNLSSINDASLRLRRLALTVGDEVDSQKRRLRSVEDDADKLDIDIHLNNHRLAGIK